jgi:HD-GYP domain-containing protein (c-di-GMP phosphodiesterase class II)
LDINGEGLCATRISAYTANTSNGLLKVLAATKAYSQLMMGESLVDLPLEVQQTLTKTLNAKASAHGNGYYAGYFCTKVGSESVIYMTFSEPISEETHTLLEIFSRNVAIAYDGLLLHEEIQNAQRDAIAALGNTIEKRGNECPLHLRRVGDVCALLAQHTGSNKHEVEIMRVAAALHDVGKFAIASEILQKPGPLSESEWLSAKTHAHEGYRVLSQSSSPVHALGAVIAHEHHERWDGSGYPRGLAGQSITLPGRIAAVADVLDSLVSSSPYKKAWTLDDAIAYIESHSGTRFDPALVTLLLANLNSVKKIYATAG